jgi:hypothetical protein
VIRTKATIMASIAITAYLSGCVTQGGQHADSALNRSIGGCVASVLVGAALGAALGAATHNKAGTGAAIGAGGGAVVCAVLMAVNNAQDKERIRQNQLAALESGRSRTDNYMGSDGLQRKVSTTVEDVGLPGALNDSPTATGADPIVGPCRRTSTGIEVTGKGTSNLDSGVVCRTAQGNYVSWNGSTAI